MSVLLSEMWYEVGAAYGNATGLQPNPGLAQTLCGLTVGQDRWSQEGSECCLQYACGRRRYSTRYCRWWQLATACTSNRQVASASPDRPLIRLAGRSERDRWDQTSETPPGGRGFLARVLCHRSLFLLRSRAGSIRSPCSFGSYRQLRACYVGLSSETVARGGALPFCSSNAWPPPSPSHKRCSMPATLCLGHSPPDPNVAAAARCLCGFRLRSGQHRLGQSGFGVQRLPRTALLGGAHGPPALASPCLSKLGQHGRMSLPLLHPLQQQSLWARPFLAVECAWGMWAAERFLLTHGRMMGQLAVCCTWPHRARHLEVPGLELFHSECFQPEVMTA